MLGDTDVAVGVRDTGESIVLGAVWGLRGPAGTVAAGPPTAGPMARAAAPTAARMPAAASDNANLRWLDGSPAGTEAGRSGSQSVEAV